MILYHGSKDIVEKPLFGKGKKNNDYGLGFYCTADPELAREWAVDENRDGYANRYDFHDGDMRILDLNSDKYCILHWITILLQNRRFVLNTSLANEAYRYLTDHYSVDISDIDVIKGYRADDSYFSYAEDFINGIISLSQLNKAMHLGNLGEKIMLRSKKAFKAIEFLDAEGVFASEWYGKKRSREEQARKEYHRTNKTGYIKGDLYMIRIIDEEVKPDDPRLR